LAGIEYLIEGSWQFPLTDAANSSNRLSVSDLKEKIWQFLRGSLPTSEFEQWVYETPELETLFGFDLFLDLLSVDYRDSDAVEHMKVILQDWFGCESSDEVVRTATAILNGSIDIITGARRLSTLQHQVYADNDPDFMTFVGINSDTDKFPIGEVRRHWSQESLVRYDAERQHKEEYWKPYAIAAARRLVIKYGIRRI
jgi:hypothetical protein